MTLLPGSAEMAFFLGCEACAAGKKLADNPNTRGTEAHRLWDRGWHDEFKRLPQALRASRLPKEDRHAAE